MAGIYRGNVSRETVERLDIYALLLRRWNPKINLVARGTLADAEQRHFADSIQVAEIATGWQRWVDLGSGGGFPGLVVACLFPKNEVVLVESDRRKCLFMDTVIRETGVAARTVNERIETIENLKGDVISARALASLEVLLGFMSQHASPNGIGLFLKGRTHVTELDEARKHWTFHSETVQSQTQVDSAILRVSNLKPISGGR